MLCAVQLLLMDALWHRKKASCVSRIVVRNHELENGRCYWYRHYISSSPVNSASWIFTS